MSFLETRELLSRPVPQAILAFLRAEPGPHRVRQLRETLGLPPHEVANALKGLQRRGLVALRAAQAPTSPQGLATHVYVELVRDERRPTLPT